MEKYFIYFVFTIFLSCCRNIFYSFPLQFQPSIKFQHSLHNFVAKPEQCPNNFKHSILKYVFILISNALVVCLIVSAEEPTEKRLRKFCENTCKCCKNVHLLHVYPFGHRLDFIHYPNETTEQTQRDYSRATQRRLHFHFCNEQQNSPGTLFHNFNVCIC